MNRNSPERTPGSLATPDMDSTENTVDPDIVDIKKKRKRKKQRIDKGRYIGPVETFVASMPGGGGGTGNNNSNNASSASGSGAGAGASVSGSSSMVTTARANADIGINTTNSASIGTIGSTEKNTGSCTDTKLKPIVEGSSPGCAPLPTASCNNVGIDIAQYNRQREDIIRTRQTRIVAFFIVLMVAVASLFGLLCLRYWSLYKQTHLTTPSTNNNSNISH